MEAKDDPNGRGHDEWFAHLPVSISTPPCQVQPNAVTGFHEREGKFYFATIDLQGQLLDTGEVIVPSHVGIHTLRGKTSKNFAYEIAWNIVRQSRSEQYTACIGIEDTSWKRDNVEVSAERNRQVFAFPYERIVTIAQLKIAQEGMLPLTQIRGVAPSRDCGYCGERLKSGSNIRLTGCPG
ncbi:MAG TPA: hypothetical protein VFS21_38180 [Roseiflexaceae bacterium]|nr:hypothetical protein [Roseiflexaceae bacterium]